MKGVNISAKYIARSSAVAARRIGDEMLIMSAVDSTLFTLNEVATAIWQAADGRTPVDQIVAEKICPAFEVTPETATADATEFISQLSQHGVLLVSDQPIQS